MPAADTWTRKVWNQCKVRSDLCTDRRPTPVTIDQAESSVARRLGLQINDLLRRRQQALLHGARDRRLQHKQQFRLILGPFCLLAEYLRVPLRKPPLQIAGSHGRPLGVADALMDGGKLVRLNLGEMVLSELQAIAKGGIHFLPIGELIVLDAEIFACLSCEGAIRHPAAKFGLEKRNLFVATQAAQL